MTNAQKLIIVGGVGAATLGFLWWQHGGKLATAAEPGDKMLGTTKVPIPKARAKRTATNAPTVNAAAVDEPFTQLQYESAAALGFSSSENGSASTGDDTTSRALNEDLEYLGVGG
jgi:hypothetical protein